MSIVILPQNTLEVWERLQREQTKLHAGLLFYRFIEVDSAKEFKYTDAGLELVCRRADTQSAAALLHRQQNLVSALQKQGFTVDTWSQDLLTRMAAGLGIASITENGIVIDHIHGLPYIPGSILKGISQDYALLYEYKVGTDTQKRRKAKKDSSFVAVFGAQTAEPGENIAKFEDRRGGVIFLDAVLERWNGPSPFEVDIMNPHYQEYYSNEGGTPPADYLNPNPIKFLAVKAGTRFCFGLAARDTNIQSTVFGSSQLINQAKDWLVGALKTLGAGGKTRVGYGISGNAIQKPKK
ncbi:CRISPR-associated protein Cmr6 [Candidatus Hakubella thermalkaliphila]|uniref:CRISPR-associated protein Cmr6 n=1 Tax=Candidatus Hakubella thermalkaliphila TaxID=2754717 RepID=A0A6V8NJG5_9ACTN|nr:type III-B CRISPR module RAMP protein Cmr6 [Candidatus Hakubella thermalkaliphila]GFP20343.1 CRISPR-associated protein Cmr6 [Candidatus Hakubella thermalkaliphila]GFP30503.1 CRISPR-associated protein Cmr6 [Candidatus Hakubella thermalkaliphila]GFP37368.1 CRISPR-associated protein Cmr6 [Candidatus Hakubella thermalkaliphila]GFP39372.1 CRISPR-associated protein Cmr6 [Candidatus Hakubella thermalkaliphila]GFP42967.1 CRISPR-associated protein Cmr6 [Candidatus Hakubella thermalkaliphila]